MWTIKKRHKHESKITGIMNFMVSPQPAHDEKWRSINVDRRHINVDTTSFCHQMSAWVWLIFKISNLFRSRVITRVPLRYINLLPREHTYSVSSFLLFLYFLYIFLISFLLCHKVPGVLSNRLWDSVGFPRWDMFKHNFSMNFRGWSLLGNTH